MRKVFIAILALFLFCPIVNAYEVKEINVNGAYQLNAIGTTFEDSVVLEDNSFVMVTSCSFASGIYKYLDSDVRDFDYGWGLTFNGDEDNDIFKSIVQLSDGSFVVAGYTESSNVFLDAIYYNPRKENIRYLEYTFTNKGGFDAWLVKVDKDGNLVWVKTYGGSGDDYFYDVEVDENDNLYVVGYSSSQDFGFTNKGNKDGILLKLDKDGNVLKKASFGAEGEDKFYSLDINNNKEIVVGGMTKSKSLISDIDKYDYFFDSYGRSILIKFNNNLEVDWYQYLPNQGDSISYSNKNENLGISLINRLNDVGYHDVIFTSDGGILAVGSEYCSLIISLSRSIRLYEDSVGVIVKYDINGKLEWLNKNPGNTNNSYEEYKGAYYDVKETSKGDFIVAGSFIPQDNSRSISLNENYDAAILLYSNSGELINHKTFSNELEYEHKNVFYSVELFNDTSVLVLGAKNYFYEESNADSNDGRMFGIKFDINFVITELETENGSFDAAEVNGTGNIVTTPNPGFAVDKIEVKDSKGNDVKVSKNSDGSYHFPLYDDVTVLVTFREYTVTKLEPENGIFETEKNGSEIKVIVKPNEGYEVEKVIVKDSNGNEITTEKNDDGIYVFDLIDDVTVNVIYEKIPESPKTGVSDYLLLGLFITMLSFGIYYLLNKKNLFKNI